MDNIEQALVQAELQDPPAVRFLKSVQLALACVLGILFMIYAEKYGSNWGVDDESKYNCDSNYPTFLFWYGLMGLILATYTALVMHLLRSKADNPGVARGIGNVLLKCAMPCYLCLICPLSCFMIGWFIYGLVLLIQSDPECGVYLYDVFLFGLIISVSYSLCLMCCCIPAVSAMKETEQKDASEPGAESPLIPPSETGDVEAPAVAEAS